MPFVLKRGNLRKRVAIICTRLVLFSSKQQHADKRGSAEEAHSDGQSAASARVFGALVALADTSALSVLLVELFGACGDFGRVGGHRGDVDCSCSGIVGGLADGRPAGGVGASSGL